MLKRSGGTRQKVWNLLMEAKQPILAPEMARKIGCPQSSIRPYLMGLARHEYARHTTAGWELIRKTGPEAPAWSAHSNELRGWNIDKPMPPKELSKALEKHGGSARAFAVALGFGPEYSGKIMAMLRGSKPVTTTVEKAVKEWVARDEGDISEPKV